MEQKKVNRQNPKPKGQGGRGRGQNRPRRQRNPGRSQQQQQTPSQVDKKSKVITPIVNNRHNRAQGTRSNIMIPAVLNTNAALASACGVLGQAYAKGFTQNNTTLPMYWAYLAFVNDLVAVMNQKISNVTGRLEYINEILSAYQPKSVPFKGVGEIAYYWDNATSVSPTNVVTVRGFGTYYWESQPSGVGPWNHIQLAPPSPTSDDETTSALARVYNLLSTSSMIGQRYIKGTDLGSIFAKDVSGFAQVLNYYGSGNSVATGPAQSSENEVLFKSIILAVMCNFVTNGTRVSRFLKFGSGDSTCAFGLGALPNFKMDWYRTCFAPIYKFIDLQEVVATLVYWYQALTAQQAKLTPTGPSDLTLSSAVQKFYTARQFGIAVRQTIMSIFNDTQSCAQFMRPSDTPNGFEALRSGSNCYGKQLSQTLRAPDILVENIAQLMFSSYEIKDRFHNSKNAQVIIPVWGVYTTALDINPTIDVWDGTAWVPSPMFAPAIATDPNYVDCTNPGGDVIDVNNSDLVQAIFDDWNDSTANMKTYSIASGYLGASAGNGNLLYYTRLYDFVSVDQVTPLNKFISKQAFAQRVFNNDRQVQKTVTRKDSKGKIISSDVETILLPPGSGIATARPVSYTSLAQITDTFKSAVNYLILPSLPLEPNVPPTQNQARVATLEAKIMPVDLDVTGQGNVRQFQIANAAAQFAPGIAASSTDSFSNVINAMNENNRGGFFGDLLGNVLTVGAKALGNAIPV